LSVTYYLDPRQVNEEARIFPQFETINPLGMTITEFHENRMSVEPLLPGPSQRTPGVPIGSSIPSTSGKTAGVSR